MTNLTTKQKTVSACKGLPTCSKCGDILPMFDKHECTPTHSKTPNEEMLELSDRLAKNHAKLTYSPRDMDCPACFGTGCGYEPGSECDRCNSPREIVKCQFCGEPATKLRFKPEWFEGIAYDLCDNCADKHNKAFPIPMTINPPTEPMTTKVEPTVEKWGSEFRDEMCEKVGELYYWRNWFKGNPDLLPTPLEVIQKYIIPLALSVQEAKAERDKEWIRAMKFSMPYPDIDVVTKKLASLKQEEEV